MNNKNDKMDTVTLEIHSRSDEASGDLMDNCIKKRVDQNQGGGRGVDTNDKNDKNDKVDTVRLVIPGGHDEASGDIINNCRKKRMDQNQGGVDTNNVNDKIKNKNNKVDTERHEIPDIHDELSGDKVADEHLQGQHSAAVEGGAGDVAAEEANGHVNITTKKKIVFMSTDIRYRNMSTDKTRTPSAPKKTSSNCKKSKGCKGGQGGTPANPGTKTQASTVSQPLKHKGAVQTSHQILITTLWGGGHG